MERSQEEHQRIAEQNTIDSSLGGRHRIDRAGKSWQNMA
jgi:hypothetical protein